MLGIYRDNGKENGNYRDYRGLYWGYTGMMEKNMETIGIMWDYIHWGCIGIMEKKTETIGIMGDCIHWGYIGMMEKKMDYYIVFRVQG